MSSNEAKTPKVVEESSVSAPISTSIEEAKAKAETVVDKKAETKAESYLIFGGKTGWIGNKVAKLLQNQGKTVFLAESRIENRSAVAKELDALKPTFVINAAALTGRPNIDWCESHKPEVIQVNVIGAVTLVDECAKRGIHVTYFGTGCVYNYDAKHTAENGVGFKETEAPNFFGSFYSKTKVIVEELLKPYDNVLTLRVRTAISDDLSTKSLIYKLSKYTKVSSNPNSVTILADMLPIAITMMQRRFTGIYNFTNPGVITNNQILGHYIKYIDPEFKFTNWSMEEQTKALPATRCNNYLDTTKLETDLSAIGITVPHISVAIVGVFKRIRADLVKRALRSLQSE